MQAAARKAPGLGTELHRSALAVDERPDGAWHVEWQALRELLRVAGGAASLTAELISGLRVDSERMRANLAITGSLIVSERVMLVDEAANDPRSLRDALRAELADWSDAAVDDVLEPENYLGASSHLIDRALKHVEDNG